MKDNRRDDTTADMTPYRRRHSYLTPGDMFSRFFDEGFMRPFFSEDFMNGAGSIAIDIKDEEDKYIVEAEIPGYTKDQIDIDVHDGMLTIKAEKQTEENVEKENYVYRERRQGSVCRSLTLDNIKEDGISAKHKDGLLMIELPKADPNKKDKRKITID